MRKLAVDIVILPPQEISELAINLNKNLIGNRTNEMVFNTKDCLPHISIAMGFIDDERILDVEKEIGKVSKQFNPFSLILSGIGFVKFGDAVISFLKVEVTPELKRFHETITNNLVRFISYDGLGDTFFKPQEEKVLNYIRNFKITSSFERYDPHITLGFGKIENTQFPIKFVADDIALCHLGDNYTCAKVFWSKKLK